MGAVVSFAKSAASNIGKGITGAFDATKTALKSPTAKAIGSSISTVADVVQQVAPIAGNVGLTALSAKQQQQAGEAGFEEAFRQADVVQEEAERNVAIRRREAEKLRATQKVGFLKSGVLLEGTPTEVLMETTRLAEEEVAATRGAASAQARAIRFEGRQALLSGFGGATQTFIRGLGDIIRT